MRMPTAGMSSDVLLALGRSHVAALGYRDETKSLVSSFQSKQAELEAAAAARKQAAHDLIVPRVALRFAEKALEHLVRQVALLAHTADDNARGGGSQDALFPQGLTAVLAPNAVAQLQAAKALRERLDDHPAAARVKAQILSELDKEIDSFRAALATRDAAEARLAHAQAAERKARVAFVNAYGSNAGAIRQMFPRSRAQQDLFFDDLATHPSYASDEDEDNEVELSLSAAPPKPSVQK